ncbi:hypothetical protein CC80DRAFT_383912, partial [Byssothecium circinans]
NNAESAINAVMTAAPEAASRIESAIGALATPSIEDLEQRIPNNISIGTRFVCVGYTRGISCSKLPLNLSSVVSGVTSGLPPMLSSSIDDALRDKVHHLQPTADRLGVVSVYFGKLLALGAILMVVLLMFFVCSSFALLSRVTNVISRLGVPYKMVALLSLGLVCCSPFVLLTALFVAVQVRTKALPPWIEAQSGEVSRLCFGALGCAVVMALLTAVTP